MAHDRIVVVRGVMGRYRPCLTTNNYNPVVSHQLNMAMLFSPIPNAVQFALYAILSCVGSIFLAQRLIHRPSRKPLTARSNQGKGPGNSYSDVFPPSQRAELAKVLPSIDYKLESNVALLKAKCLKLDADYRLADPSLSIYSGFTVGEIRELGDFPDYATLSGVSLPAPAIGFNIDTAMPRPYRPFRWNYHQTMGMFDMSL